jgi:hypothetical protein
MNAYSVGLDLGQAADYTALCVVERVTRAGERPLYHVRRVQRLPLRTPYPEVVRQVVELMQKPELQGAALVVDAMGVGMPAVDMLREHQLDPVACKVHGGSNETRDPDGSYHVPKRNLVSVTRMLLEAGEMKIAAGAEHAHLLTQELLSYRVKISEAGHDSYEAWREGDHDDLVFALGLALWWLHRPGCALPSFGAGRPREAY